MLRRAAEFRPIAEAMAEHATSPEDVEFLAQRLHGIAPDAPITLGRLTPVIGVHSGPGALAFAVVAAPEATD